jgi:hypothetical protein
MKKILILLTFIFTHYLAFTQPWTSNSVCDLTNGTQWNNGGATPCACTWYSVSGVDTTLNCAYGDCGQADLFECVYDCNGHNGNATDMVPRTCDATASPICWYQGAGSTAGADFCAGIALSIELYEFWGSAVDSYNEIYWTTASELDNDYFVVSYSKDGYDFKDIGTIDGAGTTNQEQKYRFIHGNAERGVSYYKLKQVDYNGVYEEFHIISINNHGVKTGGLFSEIYPNPSSNLFYFNYNGKIFNTPINIKIVSTLGEIVREGVVKKYNNSQAISFNLDGLESGVYLAELTHGNIREIKRVILK